MILTLLIGLAEIESFVELETRLLTCRAVELFYVFDFSDMGTLHCEDLVIGVKP